MTRGLILLGVALALLAACSAGGDEPGASPPTATLLPGQHRLEATDGSLALHVPRSWLSQRGYLQGEVVVAAQGRDPVNQLLVSVYDTTGGAEAQAVETAVDLAARGVECERVEDSPAFGGSRLVLDCPEETEGTTVRRLLIPVEHGETSILVFVQTPGETLAVTARIVQPMLESLTWRVN